LTSKLHDFLRHEVKHVVTVKAFLKGLLSESAWQSLQQYTLGKVFLEEMATYSIYLTHFTQTFSTANLRTVDLLRTVARRGAGLATPPNYQGTDLVLPIVHNDELAEITLLQVQVKNHARFIPVGASPWDVMEQQAISTHLPMVNILMDFGRDEDASSGYVQLESSVRESRRRSARGIAPPAKLRHWRLRLRGSTETTYGCASGPHLKTFLTTFDGGKQRIEQYKTRQQCVPFYHWAD
jgi:hypothetical protein